MPRGRHGRRHGHRAHHHHGIGHHRHHGIGHHHHGIGHHHHGIGHHHHGIRHHHHGIGHHHHHIGWHFRPRRNRVGGGWPFKIVLFQRRRPVNVAPAITTVTTATGETVNVTQPVTATVTQGAAGMPTQPLQQPAGYPPAQSYYPPQSQLGFPQADYPQPGYPQPGYPPQAMTDPSQPPGYYQADPYPPVDLKQPVANDGDPAIQPSDPLQQQNEEFDECTCYCCTIL